MRRRFGRRTACASPLIVGALLAPLFLEVTPARLAVRLHALASPPSAPETLHEAEALLTETADLAERRAGVDLREFRAVLRERRAAIDPPTWPVEGPPWPEEHPTGSNCPDT